MSYVEQLRSQPERLRGLVRGLHDGRHPLYSEECGRLLENPKILLTGMGASLYACYPAYLSLAAHGVNAALWETAELIHFAPGLIDLDTLVVVVSQSGETAEAVALLDRLPSSQPLLGVTNSPESPLAQRAAVVLPMEADRSPYASSQTYTNTIALLLGLARAVNRLPVEPLLEELAAAATALENFLAVSFRSEMKIDASAHLVFLARGPSMATAEQSALLFHEVAARGATARTAAAFRHGPIEMAGGSLHAFVFEPYGRTAGLVESLAKELERFGARVTRIADERLDRGELRHPPVSEELAPLVNIAAAQALSYYAAMDLGREPGVFRQGHSITRRE